MYELCLCVFDGSKVVSLSLPLHAPTPTPTCTRTSHTDSIAPLLCFADSACHQSRPTVSLSLRQATSQQSTSLLSEPTLVTPISLRSPPKPLVRSPLLMLRPLAPRKSMHPVWSALVTRSLARSSSRHDSRHFANSAACVCVSRQYHPQWQDRPAVLLRSVSDQRTPVRLQVHRRDRNSCGLLAWIHPVRSWLRGSCPGVSRCCVGRRARESVVWKRCCHPVSVTHHPPPPKSHTLSTCTILWWSAGAPLV